MQIQHVRVGSMISVDFLVGTVVRVDKIGLVPAALISWEDGFEGWMPFAEMQKFVVISPHDHKKAA